MAPLMLHRWLSYIYKATKVRVKDTCLDYNINCYKLPKVKWNALAGAQ